MLIPDNIHPNKSIYYNGAFVLKSLQNNSVQSILDLYNDVKQEKQMTFPVFTLCLDWLFLLDVAILNENAEVELCS